MLSGASFHHGFERLPKLFFLGSSLLKSHGAFVLKCKSNGAVVLKSTAYIVLSVFRSLNHFFHGAYDLKSPFPWSL